MTWSKYLCNLRVKMERENPVCCWPSSWSWHIWPSWSVHLYANPSPQGKKKKIIETAYIHAYKGFGFSLCESTNHCMSIWDMKWIGYVRACEAYPSEGRGLSKHKQVTNNVERQLLKLCISQLELRELARRVFIQPQARVIYHQLLSSPCVFVFLY